jgi:ubiquinone/menaquinone biosynthesis C-methylase UbiE
MGDVYTHGHAEPVLRSHRWRTAESSAAHLVGSLRSGQDLLDVGCGPGGITADLAALVAPGRVVGIDAEPSVLEEARTLAAGRRLTNLTFRVGDVNALGFPDASFDVVHAHQVLQHLSAPVPAQREMRRVLRPGGVLAVRDADYGAFVWAPADPLLDRWLDLYHRVCARNRAEADAGRHLPAWVRAAGFTELTVTSSTWTYADPAGREWWGGVWADRVRAAGFGEQAVAYGLSSPRELGEIAEAWRRWAAQPDGVFVIVHVEVLARPPTAGLD